MHRLFLSSGVMVAMTTSAATPGGGRGQMVPDSFSILVVEE